MSVQPAVQTLLAYPDPCSYACAYRGGQRLPLPCLAMLICAVMRSRMSGESREASRCRTPSRMSSSFLGPAPPPWALLAPTRIRRRQRDTVVHMTRHFATFSKSSSLTLTMPSAALSFLVRSFSRCSRMTVALYLRRRSR